MLSGGLSAAALRRSRVRADARSALPLLNRHSCVQTGRRGSNQLDHFSRFRVIPPLPSKPFVYAGLRPSAASVSETPRGALAAFSFVGR